MSDLTLKEIQATNVNRANRWHGGDFKEWSGLEWAGAMCGEAGEAANVAKKLKRIESSIDGNAFSEHKLETDKLITELGSEIADVLIYLTLLASRYNLDVEEEVIKKFNSKSIQMGFPERL